MADRKYFLDSWCKFDINLKFILFNNHVFFTVGVQHVAAGNQISQIVLRGVGPSEVAGEPPIRFNHNQPATCDEFGQLHGAVVHLDQQLIDVCC